MSAKHSCLHLVQKRNKIRDAGATLLLMAYMAPINTNKLQPGQVPSDLSVEQILPNTKKKNSWATTFSTAHLMDSLTFTCTVFCNCSDYIHGNRDPRKVFKVLLVTL